MIVKIAFNKENEFRTQQARELFNALNEWTLANGFQVYRTNTAHMETVIDYAPEFKAFLNSIEGTIEPNNILAPGKYDVG